jgi:hypothetical protein
VGLQGGRVDSGGERSYTGSLSLNLSSFELHLSIECGWDENNDLLVSLTFVPVGNENKFTFKKL